MITKYYKRAKLGDIIVKLIEEERKGNNLTFAQAKKMVEKEAKCPE